MKEGNVMEGKRETKATFYIGCPKCSTQVKVEGVFITEIPEKAEAVPAPEKPVQKKKQEAE